MVDELTDLLRQGAVALMLSCEPDLTSLFQNLLPDGMDASADSEHGRRIGILSGNLRREFIPKGVEGLHLSILLEKEG